MTKLNNEVVELTVEELDQGDWRDPRQWKRF